MPLRNECSTRYRLPTGSWYSMEIVYSVRAPSFHIGKVSSLETNACWIASPEGRGGTVSYALEGKTVSRLRWVVIVGVVVVAGLVGLMAIDSITICPNCISGVLAIDCITTRLTRYAFTYDDPHKRLLHSTLIGDPRDGKF